jgi:hypothetical protein
MQMAEQAHDNLLVPGRADSPTDTESAEASRASRWDPNKTTSRAEPVTPWKALTIKVVLAALAKTARSRRRTIRPARTNKSHYVCAARRTTTGNAAT